jgi:hypothetical protein
MWKDMNIFLPGTCLLLQQLPQKPCFLWTHPTPSQSRQKGGKKGKREQGGFYAKAREKEACNTSNEYSTKEYIEFLIT